MVTKVFELSSFSSIVVIGVNILQVSSERLGPFPHGFMTRLSSCTFSLSLEASQPFQYYILGKKYIYYRKVYSTKDVEQSLL